MRVDLAAELATVNRLREAWLDERRKLHAAIEDCRATKTTPPANYWEAEHRARGRFMLAANVMAILEGV